MLNRWVVLGGSGPQDNPALANCLRLPTETPSQPQPCGSALFGRPSASTCGIRAIARAYVGLVALRVGDACCGGSASRLRPWGAQSPKGLLFIILLSGFCFCMSRPSFYLCFAAWFQNLAYRHYCVSWALHHLSRRQLPRLTAPAPVAPDRFPRAESPPVPPRLTLPPIAPEATAWTPPPPGPQGSSPLLWSPPPWIAPAPPREEWI